MSSFTQAQQLREQRGRLLDQARALLKTPHFGHAEEGQFDAMMSQADRLAVQIREAELRDATGGSDGHLDPKMRRILNGLSSRPGADAWHESERDAGAKAFAKFLRLGFDHLDPEERGAIRAAQGTGSGGAGGYTVPDAPMGQLVEAMKTYGGLLTAATVLTTDTGADLPIPVNDETTQAGEIITENQPHNEQDAAFTQVVLQSYTYSSKIVRCSRQLLDDSSFDFAGFIIRALATRLGRTTSGHFTTGDGSSKPRGIVTASVQGGTTTAVNNAISYDELVDLMHDVDPAYRANAAWVMNDSTYAHLRKLKDSQLRPLYGDLPGSGPDTLLGKPIIIDNAMPDIGSATKPIVFGDVSKYFIRIVRDVRILRLEERYAENLQVGFLGFLRADGDLVDTAAVKHLLMKT